MQTLCIYIYIVYRGVGTRVFCICPVALSCPRCLWLSAHARLFTYPFCRCPYSSCTHTHTYTVDRFVSNNKLPHLLLYGMNLLQYIHIRIRYVCMCVCAYTYNYINTRTRARTREHTHVFDTDVSLISGPPGTGKTSTALALAKKIFGPKYKSMTLEVLYIYV